MDEQEEKPGNFFTKLTYKQKIYLGVGVAAFIALLVGLWIWGKAPDYKVLFSNLTDRDGGAIVSALDQLNIPHKFAEGGGAIMVPTEMVHEARLKLASQGLPKGGNVGFELMENQKFGTTQFAEQVNYQRALEGELARSVESIGSVASARVHLAIPKPTVFVKEKQKPSASVMLHLQNGRVLDSSQVSAIVHLISSSVPELTSQDVTVVDQNGALLSSERHADDRLDTKQLKYVRQIEQDLAERVERLLLPVLGKNNVRSQVTADIDFSRAEQTAEMFKPNQKPNESSVRSQQQSEAFNGNGLAASGVPGALTNQPPVPATAPIVANPNLPNAASGTGISSMQKESTVNYEVDRTIRHTILPVGTIKRLSAAVVVNGKRSMTDSKGKVVDKPFTDEEKSQIDKLIKEAIGFDSNRGDSVSIQVTQFTDISEQEEPFWKKFLEPDFIKDVIKYLLIASVMYLLIFKVIKPALEPIINPPKPEPTEEEKAAALAKAQEEEEKAKAEEEEAAIYHPSAPSYEQALQAAKQIAQQDPRIVASVIKEWVAQ